MAAYRILSFLFAWLIPIHRTRNKFRQFCESKDLFKDILKVQKSYPRIIQELKENKRPLKVIFLINDNSKWKTQSLYDLMKKSNDFEPVIVLSLAEKQRSLSKEVKEEIIKDNYEFFRNKGILCEIGWNIKKNKPISLDKFNAQIVFYQQPWGIPRNQKPKAVSKYALTCYVPYFVPNYGILSMDCRTFHKYLYRYYVLNDEWKAIYSNYMKEFGENLRAVGHTMLDAFFLNEKQATNEERYIIYAPHWSIMHKKNKNNTNYSTFDKFGQIILEYAKKHPEQKWLFKPHPKLYRTLQTIGSMSNDEIDNYYKEWEQIAETCYDGNYINLFLNSKALITDCGSFLVEYFCTGKPVIHLISENFIPEINSPFQKILDTYYKVKSKEDLYKALKNVIENDCDVKYEQRQQLKKELKLSDVYAAQNIIDDLRKAING